MLVGVATVIAFVLGTGLGILAGWRAGGWLDRSLPGLMFLQAIPYFFLALLVVQVFAVTLGWFPSAGGYDGHQLHARLELALHLQRRWTTRSCRPSRSW